MLLGLVVPLSYGPEVGEGLRPAEELRLTRAFVGQDRFQRREPNGSGGDQVDATPPFAQDLHQLGCPTGS